MPADLVNLTTQIAADYSAAFGLARISQAITVKRMYVPKFVPGKQAIGSYQVVVGGGTEKIVRSARNIIDVTSTVEIAICVKFADVEPGTVDPAMLLIQQMAEYFFDHPVSNGLANWISNEVFYWGDPVRLKQDGAFFALWDATFFSQRRCS